MRRLWLLNHNVKIIGTARFYRFGGLGTDLCIGSHSSAQCSLISLRYFFILSQPIYSRLTMACLWLFAINAVFKYCITSLMGEITFCCYPANLDIESIVSDPNIAASGLCPCTRYHAIRQFLPIIFHPRTNIGIFMNYRLPNFV